MIIAFILLLVGLFAILLEFFVPGGIVGAIGAIILFLSIISFASSSESVLLTIIYIIFLSIISFYIMKYLLFRLRHGRFKGTIYLDTDQKGFVASSWDKSLIGKEGIVMTDLKPGGHIVIDGKKYSAISQSGYLVKGEKVNVFGGEGESLIVRSERTSSS